MRDAISGLVRLGASVLSPLGGEGTRPLPSLPDVPAAVAPLTQIQSFYMAVWRLARARGLDPDSPENLRKVTQTV
jgi:glucosamine--fructose-6-phosphate aminotransferase (isomerizing)